MGHLPVNIDIVDLVTIPVPFSPIEAASIDLITKRGDKKAADYIRSTVLAVLPANLEDLAAELDHSFGAQVDRDIKAGVIDE